MAARGQAQPCGDAFSYISEGGANANLSHGQGWGKDQDRHLFARVIGARPGRIIAVIGGEHQEVVVAQPGDQLGQPRVEEF